GAGPARLLSHCNVLAVATLLVLGSAHGNRSGSVSKASFHGPWNIETTWASFPARRGQSTASVSEVRRAAESQSTQVDMHLLFCPSHTFISCLGRIGTGRTPRASDQSAYPTVIVRAIAGFGGRVEETCT